MKGIFFKIVASFLIIFSFLYLNIVSAEDVENSSSLKEIGFFTGFAKGPMKPKRDYQSIILMMRFGYDLKPLLKKINFQPPGEVQIDVEPFINPIISPDTNVEMGCGLLLKYSFPLIKKFWPYFELGSGFIYSTQHTVRLATQFNFLDQAGAGFSFRLKEDLALNLGYRYRHYSNAELESPNRGIDSHSVMCGISFLR